MAIVVRLRQDNRTRSDYPGKWFAHAVNLGTVETDDVARIIERNCSMKRSDVLAVLSELGEVVRQQLVNSHRVRLAGIGSFMAGINGRPCDRPEDYNASHVTGLHICFKPEKELRLDGTDVVPLPP